MHGCNDRYSDLQERCKDYFMMGVEMVWIIDPKTRSGRMCFDVEWVESVRLEVRGTPIYVEIEAMFSLIGSTSL